MAYRGKNLYQGGNRGELTSDDYNYFQTQGRQITQQYNLGKAQNAYERSTAKTNYSRQKSNAETAWKARFGEFQSPYVERGLLNSGIYRGGYDQFRQARNMELGDLLATYQQKTGALDLADQQLHGVYKNSWDDLASAGAARRATVAEELRRAKMGL